MEKEINALQINLVDNVVVVIEPLTKGSTICYISGEEKIKITASEDIPIYHKIASKEITKGDNIVKYGEHIGIAGSRIVAGAHVHEHNVEDHRENLEGR